jgi:DNA polymerase elongation subunit (family B)
VIQVGINEKTRPGSTIVSCETSLFESIVALVSEVDPDTLIGYDVQDNSWGYLIERAKHAYGTLNLKCSFQISPTI